ncbi:MAG: DUF4294 domain-containing protein [Alistipes sp.]|nr:DUF4294 domain-containing protein [Candidatus Alistipes equi]
MFVAILICFDVSASFTKKRPERGYVYKEWIVENGDSVPLVHLAPIRKYARGRDMRRYQRMVRAVRKVYPISLEAKREMLAMEMQLKYLPTKRERKAYIASVQKRIIKQYTPILRKMTIYEGKILLKLIDRQTDYSAYAIVKEFRGGFVAGFWQTMAKLFGNNLKTEYDPEGEDRLLEQIVTLYERGAL